MELLPALTEDGLAPNEIIDGTDAGGGGAAAAVTVTVTVFSTEPASLVAVNVYVVVSGGELVALPDAGTEGAPGSIDTVSASETSHSRTVLSPSSILVALALNVLITGREEEEGVSSEAISTVMERVTEPCSLVAVNM